MPPKTPEIDWGGVLLHGLLVGFWTFLKIAWPYLIAFGVLIYLKERYLSNSPRSRRRHS